MLLSSMLYLSRHGRGIVIWPWVRMLMLLLALELSQCVPFFLSFRFFLCKRLITASERFVVLRLDRVGGNNCKKLRVF